MSYTITKSGGQFDLLNPTLDQIDIYDISGQLANQCRFGGSTGTHYSIAQHSVLVSYLCDNDHAMIGLMHDAAEAYIGDIKKPVKDLWPEVHKIEDPILQAIFDKFNVDCRADKIPADVKHADEFACEIERYSFIPQKSFWRTSKYIKEYGKIEALSIAKAEESFIARFKELFNG